MLIETNPLWFQDVKPVIFIPRDFSCFSVWLPSCLTSCVLPEHCQCCTLPPYWLKRCDIFPHYCGVSRTGILMMSWATTNSSTEARETLLSSKSMKTGRCCDTSWHLSSRVSLNYYSYATMEFHLNVVFLYCVFVCRLTYKKFYICGFIFKNDLLWVFLVLHKSSNKLWFHKQTASPQIRNIATRHWWLNWYLVDSTGKISFPRCGSQANGLPQESLWLLRIAAVLF